MKNPPLHLSKMNPLLEIVFNIRNNIKLGRRFKTQLQGMLHQLQWQQHRLSIHFVGKKRMQTINQKYRQQNKVTDVLTFPLHDQNPEAYDLGAIMICVDIAKKQAKLFNCSLESQILRLIAHGLIHLTGLDHETSPKEFKKFLQREKRLLTPWLKNPMPLGALAAY